MKKLLLLPLLSLLFLSCEGPMGPPGRDGQVIVGQMFEANISFNSGNNYEEFIDIPSQIDVFPTDIIVAYILVGEFEGRDIWEPLPQTLFFDDGTLLYGYNYTLADVSFFLDGTVNLDFLDSSFTQNIVFRVAVLPADQVQGLDLNNMDNVLNTLNKEIIKIN
jgi:hypothetical protein